MGEQAMLVNWRSASSTTVLLDVVGKELTEGDESIFSEADSKRLSLIEMLSFSTFGPGEA